MPRDRKPICVIPARGRSKRSPRKNLALFRGRTLVGLTVDTALESGVYSRVVVSTDDEGIGSAASEAGAEIRERPPALAGDFVTLEPVLLDVVDAFASSGVPDDIGSVMPTISRLRRAEDVREAYARFSSSGGDYLMVVSRYIKSPFLALSERDAFASLRFPELARQQPSPAVWVDTGMVYFARIEALRSERTFYGRRPVTHEIPAERAIDVDEPYHLRLAELLSDAWVSPAGDERSRN
jgi:pseudaminic acid cytidylyltransferase